MKTISIFFFAFFVNAHAYNFTNDFSRGIFWASYPISFKVVEGAGKFPLRDLLLEAKDEWESAVGSSIWEFSFEGNSSNLIRWSINFAEETGHNPSSTLAVTIRSNNGSLYTQVQIILNSEYPALVANANNLLKKTLIHELGHTVGLDHSPGPAIMEPTVGHLDGIQDDDRDGIQAAINTNQDRIAHQAYQRGQGDSEQNALDVLSCGGFSSVSLAQDGQQSGSGSRNMLIVLIGLAMGFLRWNLILKKIKLIKLRSRR